MIALKVGVSDQKQVFIAKSARVYGRDCAGCAIYDSDFMLSILAERSSGFVDVMLTKETAVALHEELGRRIKELVP